MFAFDLSMVLVVACGTRHDMTVQVQQTLSHMKASAVAL